MRRFLRLLAGALIALSSLGALLSIIGLTAKSGGPPLLRDEWNEIMILPTLWLQLDASFCGLMFAGILWTVLDVADHVCKTSLK
jgi:hypothetical protein